MTLLDAPAYDNRREKRRRIVVITAAAVIVIALIGFFWWPRFTARRTVDDFFQALERKNFQEAYYIWKANPKLYPMDAFMADWGPGSKWGTITTYRIDELGPPSGGHASGLVALVEINGIKSDEARIWIQNGSHELSFYQF